MTATLTPPAARAAAPRDGGTPAVRLALVASVVALGALLFAPRAVLGFDALFHVLWGRALGSGHLPVYDPATAPTPHPLQLLLAALLSPLGGAAPDALRLVHLLALGGLAAGLVELGRRLAGWGAGLVAAALVCGQPYVLDLAQRGQADVPALALVVWAAVLVVRAPFRPVPVLVLLLLGGLLRPEVWLLSVAYGLSCRRRALLPVAVAAPVLWVLSDLVVTGDPLWSFTQTHDITESLQRVTGLGNALPKGVGGLLHVVGLVPAVVGLLGLVAALLAARRRTAVPLLLVGLGALGFSALAAAQLSLQPRYLLTATAGWVLLAAVAACSPTSLGLPRWTGRVALAALVVGAGLRVPVTAEARLSLVADDRSVYAVLHDPRFTRALATCGPVVVATAYLVPHVELALPGVPVVLAPARGLYLGPSPTGVTSIGGGAAGVRRTSTPPPAGAPRVLQTADWRVLADCAGRGPS